MILTPKRKNKLTPDELKQIINVLDHGEVIAIPTETVYGLAADAENPDAIKKIYTLKGRPINHPLILHVGDKKDLEKYAIDIPREAYLLADHFWPGPLTIILKKSANVDDLITANQDTVAIRIPNHPLTLQILKEFRRGLVAPSANKFGHVSPTTAEHVFDEFTNNVPIIIDGGATTIGIESTILNLSDEVPIILRPGMITKKMLEDILQKKVFLPEEINNQNQPQVSGNLKLHYAPKTKTILVKSNDFASKIIQLQKNKKIAVLSRQQKFKKFQGKWIVMSNDPHTAAKKLYKQLREIDKLKFDLIVIENVNNEDLWRGIKDRITKASN